MFYRKCLPDASLQRYVSHYWTMNGNLGSKTIRSRDIPDGNVEAIINFGSPFKKIETHKKTNEYPRGGIKGQFDHAVIIEQSGEVDIVGISFKPWGFYPFIKQTLNEIANIASPLDLLVSNDLVDQLYETRRSGSWVDVLNRALASKIDLNEKIDPLLVDSIHSIRHSPSVSIDQLSKSYGVTMKNLQRLYKQKIGITPKQFARVIRLQKLLSQIPASQPPNWMKLVVDFNFHDRSHLCHEFQAITGLSPVKYSLSSDTFSVNYS